MVGRYGTYGEISPRGREGLAQIFSALQQAAQPALVEALQDPALQAQITETRMREQRLAEQEVEQRLKKWAAVAALGGVAFLILLGVTLSASRPRRR
jgi:hypothetical protein